MPTANEIRQQFIDFFVQQHGHTFVPSSSVVPRDDPTLLFTNAGMNQFKDVFLGTGTRPYKRAANTQKCIRAGGKHNDLEDVGKDTYHHTFFEMLGNWSFGDYFKKEAIRWAWELLTNVWGLDKSRLHATVFEGDPQQGLAPDDEAAALWHSETDIDPSHIHKGNKKDNFWEMGETGPCGPCTEIHIDRTPDKSGGKLVNKGTADVIEIWNLVFIQFNRGPDNMLTPLPAKHVDTGMGFERICAVLQGKTSNYDTDVFTPIMDAIGDLVKKKYNGKLEDINDVAFRVIADHLRMLTFAITDGALPSNKGSGAVLRSVLRRAFRFGYQRFDQREPFIWKLVPALVAQMGGAYPELKVNPERVQGVIRGEESDFLRTIERGLSLFNQACEDALTQFQIASGRAPGTGPKEIKPLTEAQMEHWNKYPRDKYPTPVIADTVVFNLHTTYGFPPDLTCQMAQERNLAVDMAGYERLMREHEEKSRAAPPKRRMPRPPQVPPSRFAGGTRRPPIPPPQVPRSPYASQTPQQSDLPPIALGGPEDDIEEDEARVKPYQLSPDQTVKLLQTDDSPKYQSLTASGRVVGWVTSEGKVIAIGRLEANEDVDLLLDQTNFYAEQGGQVGDVGRISTPSGVFVVNNVDRVGNTVRHIGRVSEGSLEVGQDARLEVDSSRLDTMRNHTATHLLNWALRKVLGEHVEQRGSLVDPDKTRFDFTHDKPLSAEEIADVERLVNEKIYLDLPVTPVTRSLAEAKKVVGVRAVFGEKYPDPVRVLLIGPDRPEDATREDSVEFCGGTHLTHTGQAGFFKIVSQELVGKGVRRVTAVTGREAVATVQRLAAVVDDLTGRFNCQPEDLPRRVEVLQEEVKKLQAQLRKGAASDLAGAGDRLLAQAVEANGSKIIVGEMPAAPVEQMRQQLDRLREKAKSAVVVIGWADEGKVGLLSLVTDDLGQKGLHAGKLVGEVAKVVGGKGGGPPTGIAQAGGKDASKLGEALQLAKKLASEKLSG